MYKVTLQFDTHKITYGTNRGQWVLTKEFNDTATISLTIYAEPKVIV